MGVSLLENFTHDPATAHPSIHLFIQETHPEPMLGSVLTWSLLTLELIFKIILEFSTMVIKKLDWGFPGGAVVENLPADAGDTGSSPGLGRSHMPRSN